MSRSRKKNPVVKETDQKMKAYANRKIRRQSICIANGNAYKKQIYRYAICDWRFRYTYAEYTRTKEMYKKEYANGVHPFPFSVTKDWSADMNCWNWYKDYKRK